MSYIIQVIHYSHPHAHRLLKLSTTANLYVYPYVRSCVRSYVRTDDLRTESMYSYVREIDRPVNALVLPSLSC